MDVPGIVKRLSDNVDKYEPLIKEYVKDVFGSDFEHISNLSDDEFRLVSAYASNLFISTLNYELTQGFFYTKEQEKLSSNNDK